MATCRDCFHWNACENMIKICNCKVYEVSEGAEECEHFTPTADVEEVKYGEWIEKEELYGDVYYTCSNCNNDWTTIDGTPQQNFMNYCPNCGAKMDSQL